MIMKIRVWQCRKFKLILEDDYTKNENGNELLYTMPIYVVNNLNIPSTISIKL